MSSEIPTVEQLDDIAEQVWAAFLDDGNPAVIGFAAGDERGDLAASVSVAGAWEGTLVVSCTDDASREVASALFAMPVSEVTPADIGDALGELANVLGGNVKSMLPSPSTLSLPEVFTTDDDSQVVEVCRTVVTWRERTFTVALLKSPRAVAQEEVAS
ncbi:hypothetical protein GCM10022243_41290 [Saccharothrix violaceirubra]|uniref:Chemotaxis protein CheX n=1 Tax=Saccharothrix violaceirubra TaxID=413306 RepID=A0A7W7TAT3_9PSEU|nr:chemotaxis protein CheX [Saccharothrix violaceirubra]MBB4968385.1 chemotaxis protein CheX [Saccharothrix violaceirubra]